MRKWIFYALCCDLGMICKKLISPAANVITELLRIPGGIGTSFSLLFLVVAAMIFPMFGAATLMGVVQSLLAFAMGSVGSMGALSPVAYIVPGFAIDVVLFVSRKVKLDSAWTALLSNMAGSAAACLIANVLVFRLHGIVLLFYLSVALTSGAVCGLLAGQLTKILRPVLQCEERRQQA